MSKNAASLLFARHPPNGHSSLINATLKPHLSSSCHEIFVVIFYFFKSMATHLTLGKCILRSRTFSASSGVSL